MNELRPHLWDREPTAAPHRAAAGRMPLLHGETGDFLASRASLADHANVIAATCPPVLPVGPALAELEAVARVFFSATARPVALEPLWGLAANDAPAADSAAAQQQQGKPAAAAPAEAVGAHPEAHVVSTRGSTA